MRLAYHVLALSTALSVLRSPLSVLRAQDRIQLPGLERPVEILKDRWGISHIYAESEHDLFFAQGYNAARDRLFQLELWRRQATGTVAEMLGPRELQRDIGTRLFKFRKDLVQELRHYHPKGAAIVNAFVAGVNAYVDYANREPERLPLGFGPGDPDLTFDQAIDPKLLSANILERYNAFRTELRFQPEDVAAPYRAAGAAEAAEDVSAAAPAADIGSNNWVVSGERSESRYPMMANDPHRAQSAPSLRYWVHLVGPGWNVIGGGEPALPGVAIGHNGYGAWGLTVFSTDGEDLYVYDTNPQDPNQYRYYGQWEPMTVLREQISVRGEGERTVELKYTRHGPVVFEDREHRKAYAVRAAWMEIGGAPYLASPRMG